MIHEQDKHHIKIEAKIELPLKARPPLSHMVNTAVVPKFFFFLDWFGFWVGFSSLVSVMHLKK